MTVQDADLASSTPHHPGMDRRRFLLSSLAGALAAPRAVAAQSASRVQRLAVYTGRLVSDGLVEALNERGWTDG